MEHSNSHPVIGLILAIASATGIASLSLNEIDLLSGIVLKWVSIFSFAIAAAYTLWQWRIKYKKNKNDNR